MASLSTASTHHALSLAARRLSRFGRFADADALLSSHLPASPTEPRLAAILCSYASASLPDSPLAAFRSSAPSLPSPISPLPFNALLSAFIRCRRHRRVLVLFAELSKEFSITPNATSYAILVKAYCMTRHDAMAQQVLDQMREQRISPKFMVVYRGRGRGRGVEHEGRSGQQDPYCGRGGDRGGHRDAARGRGGGGERGGHFPARQPGGRGRFEAEGHVVEPAELEALSGKVERRMVVAEAGEGSSSSAPDAAASGVEESQVVVAPAGRLPPASSKALVVPPRPGLGTIGKQCRVRANHFVVQAADKEIYHYDVSITPESRSRERNKSIIVELVRLHKQYLDERLPVYDGRKGMFTVGPLPFQFKEFVVKIANPEKGNHGEKEYKVTIKDAAKLDLYSLKQFLAGRHRELPQDTIQALVIALRECPSANYISISRSFFSEAFGHGGDIGSGFECWRGYYQSLRPTQMGLSLNIDISATAFYKAQPVIDFAAEYLNIRDASRRLFVQDCLKLKKALKGVRVVATHRRDISIRYMITGLTSAPLNELTFDQDGTRVSVVQYFKHQYNYSLKYTNWPCLQAGSDSRPIYLPMEACNILKGQRYSRKLNEHQVTNILKLACERPAQRENIILEIISRNSYGNDDYAKEFGIKVMNQLALVDAHVLPTPRQINGRPCVDIGQARQDNLEAALRTIHRQSVEQLELLIIVLPEVNASIRMITGSGSIIFK